MTAATPHPDTARASESALTPAEHQIAIRLLSRAFMGLLALVAFASLFTAVVLWQRVGTMQEQLVRQSADATSQSVEARALARQASETVRDAAARVALTETRVAELEAQRTQVQELVQSLSRSRDDTLLVDVEATLRLALQQAQVTGNAEPLLSALKSAEQRVTRSAQPRLAPLTRAIQRDADRLRASATGDRVEALQRLDDLIRSVDDLPVLNAMKPRDAEPAAKPEILAADAPWWTHWLWLVRQEARSLVRVSRIDNPEAVLLTPEQGYFLRENLKLKLLNARLALLSRQTSAARTEINTITAVLNRYFDPASRRTQAAATQLQQLQAQIRNADPLSIDDTLAALAAAGTGR